MNGEMTRRNTPALPAEVGTEIRRLSTSPEKYLSSLPAERIEDRRPRTALTLAQCSRALERDRLTVYLGMMIIEVNDFLNVRGNMNEKQIRLTAEMILDTPAFSDLTLGNIKACFRQKMAAAKIYDRLDGNIIIGWLREFKSDLADWCETVHEGEDRIRQREETSDGAGAITHEAYLAMLRDKAVKGDREAKRILDDYRKRSRIPTPEQERQKQIDFMRFKHGRLKQQGYFNNKTDRQ